MVRVARPIEFAWLEGRFWEVPHPFGSEVAICGMVLPADPSVPREWVDATALVRALRMSDRTDAVWYLASHAVLRSMLASALGVSPNHLELTTRSCGKPGIAGDPLRFNMSRSGATVLIGISVSRDIGVDIEIQRRVPSLEGLAQANLSPSEYAAWLASEPLSRDRKFLELWTRKEACVKAAGIGNSLPLDRVDVGGEALEAPIRVAFRFGSRDWSVRLASLRVPPNLIAAAAVVE
jgi:4'-phosphopantetheinyl transferase